MASEYQALLDEPPKQSSEYSALLAPTPQDQGSTAVQPVSPRTLRESFGRFLGKARDIGTEALSQISPEASARVFGQTEASLRPEQISQPLVSPETASQVIGQLPTWAGGQTPIAQGVAEGAAGAVSELSRPSALAQLPAFAVPGVAETFAANVASELPAQGRRLGETLGTYGILSKEAGQALTEAGLTDAMGFLAGKTGTGARFRAGEKAITPEPVAATPEAVAASIPELLSKSPEALTEIPRQKNAPVESGGSAVAQGDLDALRASNAARLAEGLPAQAPKITKIGIADENGDVLVEGKLGEKAHEDLMRENIDNPAVLDAFSADQGNVTGPQRNVFIDDTGKTWTRAQLQEAGLPIHSQELAKLAESPVAAEQSATAITLPIPAQTAESAMPATEVSQVAPNSEATSAVSSQNEASTTATEMSPTIAEAATASVGPGAASITEPLASYEKRRFGERLQQDQSIDPAIREQTGNRYYEPIPNAVTVGEAEKLIEKRGTDESIRLVRDESFPMQPRVRVTVGEALIKKLNQSHQEAKAAGNEVHADEFLQQAVDTAEYLSGYGTTLGQGVQAFAIWNKLSPEGRLLEATRLAEKSGIELTPEQLKKVNELNAEIEKAPEGFQKDEKTQDLMAFMSEIKGLKPSEIPIALWYSNILSGFTTQLVNTIDTALNVFSESFAMAASHPSDIPAIVSGLYQGMIKGGFEAASALKTGRSISGDKLTQQRVLERVRFGEKGGVPIDTSTPMGAFQKRAFESKLAIPLNLWKYPLRAMVASDTVFYNSFKEAQARVMARAIAKTEGLSGDALFRRVEEIINQSPETLDTALRQAQDEGLSGLNQRRRVQEIIEQGRSDELVGSTTEAAQIATYNHDPSGVLGLVAANIANITEGFPLGKFIVPFTRIVANVTNRGLNYTPWGYKRLFFGEWGGRKFGTEPPTGEAYRTQLVKATLGTTAMTAIALLDANNIATITATGPQDVDEKRQLQNTGWKPYSVKIGDKYYSYQYTPFSLGFAMIGHYRDAIRYNKLSEKDAATRLAYGMLKAGSTIFDMSFLSGVSDFIETVQGQGGSTKGAGRLFARTASSVVIPNLVKQTDKLFDPTLYQADTVTQALIRETPVARSAVLKPMLNVLGEPIAPSQNRFFTSDTKDPVWQLIVEKQAWVPVPSKTTKIGDRPITADEYYRLIKESGPQIREYVQSNIGTLRDMSGQDAQEAVQKESQRIRRIVKSGF